MRTLASTGRSLSTACRRATPMVPLAHLSRGLRRDGPGRAKSRGSYDTSQFFSKQFSPSCTAPHPYYQRCWTPVAVPPLFPPRPTALRWPFSSRYTAGLRGVVRARADFLGSVSHHAPARVSPSPSGYSPSRPAGAPGQSPQADKTAPIQNKGLRADESSGWMGLIVAQRKRPTGGQSIAEPLWVPVTAGLREGGHDYVGDHAA
jgi:hypothetical protein